MENDFTRKQLLSVVKKLIDTKEAKFDRHFLEVVALVLGPKLREEMVCSILSDMVKLHKGETPEHELALGTERFSNSRILDALSESNWPYFLKSKCERKKQLARDIQESIYSGGKLPFFEKVSGESYYIDEDSFSRFFEFIKDLSPFNSFAVKNLLSEGLFLAEKKIPNSNQPPTSLKKLFKVFELSEVQQQILCIYWLFEALENFENFIRHTSLDFSERKKAPRAVAKLLNLPLVKVKAELRSESKLMKSLLLTIDKEDLELSEHISDYLQNDDDSGDVFSYFFEKCDSQDVLDIKQHRLEKLDLQLFKHLLGCKKGSNFLLYGKPGTGKTEFTRSIGKELGVDVFKVKTHDQSSDNLLKQKRSALIAAKTILPKDSFLVIDEAEQILSSGFSMFSRDKTDHKAWLNTFMEEHCVNIIWITNDLFIHSSTKRRFDYAIEFESFNVLQRIEALKNIQAKAGTDLFSPKEIESISKEYTLDPGALNLSINKISNIQEDKANKKKLVKAMLDSQMKLLKRGGQSETSVETFYDPRFVNTSMDESEILSYIKHYYEEPERIRNLCILFQGVPGTGKTEYAKYLSDALQRSMNVKRASDILSKWVGETEQNIARLFKESEKNEEILFLDECDSLFRSRNNAEHSWEVTRTNELLTQMERFQGVLICATNFLENLDKAALRRFHLKVRFDDLLPANLPHVFSAFFKKELSQREILELVSIKSLNPGDFKAVYNSTVFMKDISNNELINRLKEEVSYKKTANPIGLK